MGADGIGLVTIHQPECLPWLGFVDKLRRCDVFVLLDSVQFEKGYFQNRNRIRAASGAAWLTVPVRTAGRLDQAIRDVEIESAAPWVRKHVETWRQHYARAPFFAALFPGLEAIYRTPWKWLVDLNIAVIEWIGRAFGLERRLVRSSELGVGGRRSELLREICVRLGAREYLSGVSGRDYLDETLFREAGIGVRYHDFRHPVYRQCYEPFLPNMSSIDLLLNEGPAAPGILAAANEAA